MVGVRIPIAIEGGKSSRKPVNYPNSRRGSAALSRKPLQRKDSRQKLKTFNVEIHLEAATSNGTKEKSFITKTISPPQQKISEHRPSIVKENARKSGIANKKTMEPPNSKTAPVETQRLFRRRQSSRDLGVAQGTSGILKMMSRRQSSTRDLLEMRRKSHGKVVIRRDSVNGLRIITKNDEDEDDTSSKEEMEALERLKSISLEDKSGFSKFEVDALQTHNKYRKRHGVPPLKLSKELSDVAQEYAEHLANTNTFEHSGDPIYGENLYWSWSSDPSWVLGGTEPVDSWYDEKKGYDYSREPPDSESGHFTQLVWAGSFTLGVGVAKSPSTGKYLVVMKYDPAGNYLGKYRQNVKKPVTFGGNKNDGGC